MVKLYGQPMSRAARCAWAMEELGVPYEWVRVNPMAGEAQRPEVTAVNPIGKVPAIEDGDLKLAESLAINLYLAQKHGAGGLWPSDPAAQAKTLQWSFFAMTELEPPLVQILVQKMFTEGGPDEAQVQAAEEALKRPLKVLDGELADKPYLLGEEFTIADLNVASVLSLGKFIGWEPPAEFAHVRDWLGRCLSREKFGQVMAAQ